jgi:RNA recognition motif-containing protein
LNAPERDLEDIVLSTNARSRFRYFFLTIPFSRGTGLVYMTMKLYVGNLPFSTSNSDLEELFAGIGTVESATVVEDRETGRSRGFGFVEMASQEEGAAAIEQLNGSDMNGRELKVNEARPRENRGFGGPRGGGGGGRGGYGGGGGGNFGGGRHGQNRW